MVSLIPSYFPPISHWKYIINNKCYWNTESFYQKQTLRNRTYIHGANGILMLSVPVKHSGKNIKRKFNDILVENNQDWKKNHFKSIKTAYQSSPYYEFYENKIIDFFNQDTNQLYKLNLSSINLVLDCLKLECFEINDISKFKTINDLNFLTNVKRSTEENTKYIQTFEEKNGFINDLSILDLLFNCGPNSLDYIQ
ncbi:MAG: hypothetical protein CMC45_00355 [Flavobacteriaceae bacterium]|nr:hypothetical protein [Flavobacteriaceae bacterium]